MVLSPSVCEVLRPGGSGELESKYLWGSLVRGLSSAALQTAGPSVARSSYFGGEAQRSGFYVKTSDSYNLAANVQFLCTM